MLSLHDDKFQEKPMSSRDFQVYFILLAATSSLERLKAMIQMKKLFIFLLQVADTHR